MTDSDFQFFDNLVGIPYKVGCADLRAMDCGGLVKYVYKEMLDITLPDFLFEVDPYTPKNVIKTFTKSLKYWHELDEPEYLSMVAMGRRGKLVSHCGVYTGDGMVIHSIDNLGVRWESFKDIIIQHQFQFSHYAWQR